MTIDFFRPPQTLNVSLMTCRDAIEYAKAFLGGGSDAFNTSAIYTAVQAAWRDVIFKREWKSLQKWGRITTNAPYSTGTVEYDYTGDTYERQILLTGGTWPTWTPYANIKLTGYDVYKVEDRYSASEANLRADSAPTSDISVGTGVAYTLFQDTYLLPVDFHAIGRPQHSETLATLDYITADEWMVRRRESDWTSGDPYAFCIFNSPDVYGRLAMGLYPYPDAAETIDFVYHSKPKLLVTGMPNKDTQGTITGAGTTTVTGTGTAFESGHVGSVLRVAPSGTDLPTGPGGLNQYVEEFIITAVASTTSITVDRAMSSNYTTRKYVVSSPVDLDDSLMNLFLRGIERQLAMTKSHEHRSMINRDYQEALMRAYENDSHRFVMADMPEPRTRAHRIVTSVDGS